MLQSLKWEPKTSSVLLYWLRVFRTVLKCVLCPFVFSSFGQCETAAVLL